MQAPEKPDSLRTEHLSFNVIRNKYTLTCWVDKIEAIGTRIQRMQNEVETQCTNYTTLETLITNLSNETNEMRVKLEQHLAEYTVENIKISPHIEHV